MRGIRLAEVPPHEHMKNREQKFIQRYFLSTDSELGSVLGAKLSQWY